MECYVGYISSYFNVALLMPWAETQIYRSPKLYEWVPDASRALCFSVIHIVNLGLNGRFA